MRNDFTFSTTTPLSLDSNFSNGLLFYAIFRPSSNGGPLPIAQRWHIQTNSSTSDSFYTVINKHLSRFLSISSPCVFFFGTSWPHVGNIHIWIYVVNKRSTATNAMKHTSKEIKIDCSSTDIQLWCTTLRKIITNLNTFDCIVYQVPARAGSWNRWTDSLMVQTSSCLRNVQSSEGK